MSGESFETEFDTRELERVIEDMGDDVEGKLRGIMSVVAEMLVTGVSDRYDSSGGGTWEPNKPSTIKKKGSAKPMINSSVLANSTRGFFGSNFAEATTSVGYVVFHLDGGDIIPQRNPFELDDEVLDGVEDFVLDQITKALAG